MGKQATIYRIEDRNTGGVLFSAYPCDGHDDFLDEVIIDNLPDFIELDPEGCFGMPALVSGDRICEIVENGRNGLWILPGIGRDAVYAKYESVEENEYGETYRAVCR
ncbi:hypothetical protein GMI70_02765 [Eggerthellaceae bacterium zg-893]|nr:hypothetical protein [Eggerthellaceae bacterium zg-893]